MRHLLSLLIGLLLFPALSIAKDPIRTIEGIVVKVSDGDTINVQEYEKPTDVLVGFSFADFSAKHIDSK